MSDPSALATVPLTAIDPPKRMGGPNMVKGAPSINPKGRPRIGESIAEVLRTKLTADEFADRLLKLTGSQNEKVALHALLAWAERAWGKVPTIVDATVSNGNTGALGDLTDMPIEKRRELAAALREVRDRFVARDQQLPEPKSAADNSP